MNTNVVEVGLAPPGQVIQIAPARYVLPHLAASITGLTIKAINRKIETGVWADGLQYHKAPDGRNYIDMEGYAKWVQTRYRR